MNLKLLNGDWIQSSIEYFKIHLILIQRNIHLKILIQNIFIYNFFYII